VQRGNPFLKRESSGGFHRLQNERVEASLHTREAAACLKGVQREQSQKSYSSRSGENETSKDLVAIARPDLTTTDCGSPIFTEIIIAISGKVVNKFHKGVLK